MKHPLYESTLDALAAVAWTYGLVAFALLLAFVGAAIVTMFRRPEEWAEFEEIIAESGAQDVGTAAVLVALSWPVILYSLLRDAAQPDA